MRALKKIESNAKIASRRFSKSIVCRILKGPVVGFIIANQPEFMPSNILFGDPNIGLSSNKGRVLAITLYDFPDFEEVLKLSGIVLAGSPSPEDRLQSLTESYNFKNLLQAEHALRKKEPLLKFLKQNMIVAYVNLATVPKQLPQLIVNERVDLLIDSIDTTQAINGTFIPRTQPSELSNAQWTDQ